MIIKTTLVSANGCHLTSHCRPGITDAQNERSVWMMIVGKVLTVSGFWAETVGDTDYLDYMCQS